jgi:hypothetical protein
MDLTSARGVLWVFPVPESTPFQSILMARPVTSSSAHMSAMMPQSVPANRLVGILDGCLRNGAHYDERIAWPKPAVHDHQCASAKRRPCVASMTAPQRRLKAGSRVAHRAIPKGRDAKQSALYDGFRLWQPTGESRKSFTVADGILFANWVSQR